MEILIRIDWISITDKMPNEFKTSAHSCLSDGNWHECAGKNGYNVGQKHVTGVREYRNYNRKDMGRHIVYSSKALDRIKEMKNVSGTDVLIEHIKNGHSVARLDLAIDFIEYGLSVNDFVDAFTDGQVKTRLRKASVIKSLVNSSQTLYLGSLEKRKNLIRIYDKGVEQNIDMNWIRVELQIMGKKATLTGVELSKSENIKEAIICIIQGIADFPTIDVWRKLTSSKEFVKMSTIPKAQGDTEKWLMTQVIPALSRTIVLNMDFWVQFQLALEVAQEEYYKDEFKKILPSK